ncbi:MAG: ATP phosphoribosyltransferase [Hyphomicrobiaceae bacterium]
MADKVILAIPSKGRLMERSLEVFKDAGLAIEKTGHERGYLGRMDKLDQVEVAFLSASEIALFISRGRVHMGVTGEDLVRESVSDADARVDFLKPLGFGHADVVVAVPTCWIDVDRVGELEDVAVSFRRVHGRRLCVATKYLNLTRRFFSSRGVTSYRIVESLGATEGTPAAGTAELIVDITSSGATLRANNLKVLEDGIILKSQANLIASKAVDWSSAANEARNEIMSRLSA